MSDENKSAPTVHVCGPQGKCGCNCPESCGHDFTGPMVEFDGGYSSTCKNCGMPAISHGMWVLP